MSKAWQVNRRTALRGLGTAIALPWLEAMTPTFARAGASAAKPPLRLAFLYVPNGIHMQTWTPREEGSAFEFPATLESLKDLKDDLLVLTGLTQHNAYALGDGGGDHARALSCFLTGMHPFKTGGANIKVGTSVDQVAAQHVGRSTMFPSLELGCEPGAQAGACDTGYSCAYSSNISWRTESAPAPKEVNPRLVFDRLFSRGSREEVAANRARRDRRRKSILDFVADDARRLRGRLGASDNRKVEEYLASIRELEQRVARASEPAPEVPEDFPTPAGIPKDYAEHIALMADLMLLAFQTDVTRVSTFVLANEGSNRSYRFLDVPEGHHDLSHHGGKKEKHEKLKTINTFHVTQLARFLAKLKATPEGEGNLLDQSMIVYGSGIGDGNRHNHNDLPIILAGRGGGTIKPGRHVKYPKNTPLNNLFLSLLDRLGVHPETFGDSKGRLNSLEG